VQVQIKLSALNWITMMKKSGFYHPDTRLYILWRNLWRAWY